MLFLVILAILVFTPLIIGSELLRRKKAINTGKILILSGVLIFITVLLFVLLLLFAFSSVHAVFSSIISIIVAVLILFITAGGLWGFIKKKYIRTPVCICVCLCLVVTCGYWGYNIYINSIPTVGETENLLASYSPYGDNTKVATLDELATLQITEDIPRLNGATALYPVYSAFARAVYPKYTLDHIIDAKDYQTNWNYLCCDTTTQAYEMIVDGGTDIIFVAGPSYEQEKYAEEKGIELVYTPIGKEAFVFFVNAKNPIEDLSVEQIQSVYSGDIIRWDSLGVSGFGSIRAFQRDEGSGSQTSLRRLMGGIPLMEAPTENVIGGMGGIIEKTADYKNYKNAIGYSFRFYSTEMVNNDQIKLLSINGVYPNIENIENGTYPIASYFYAVTRSDADENTKAFVEWVLSPQGQELIKKTGYTPINK